MEIMEKQPKTTAGQRPRKGWQRVTAKQPQSNQTRETFRRDAPSPCQEILAKHDSELNEQQLTDDQTDSKIICF